MEKKDIQAEIRRDLTQREQEEIKQVIIRERVKGSCKSSDILAKELSSDLPMVTEDSIKRLERDPNFGKQLFLEHQTRTNHKAGDIWDKLIERAVLGDMKAMRLYYELTKSLSKENDRSRSGIQNVIQLSGLPAEQLDAQYKDYGNAI